MQQPAAVRARGAARQMVATIRSFPMPRRRRRRCSARSMWQEANRPLVSVAPVQAMRAGLVQTRLPGTR